MTPKHAETAISTQGLAFYSTDFTLDTRSGNVLVAGSAHGNQGLYVDDVIDIDVTHSDGSESSVEMGDINCSTGSDNIPAYSLASVLEPGVNALHVVLSDTCGTDVGNNAVYLSGDATFQTSTTAISAKPAGEISAGQQTRLTAVVKSAGAGVGIPAGTVQFSVNGASVGGPVTLKKGKASVSKIVLPSGNDAVRASYSGDPTHDPSNATDDVQVNGGAS